MKHLLLTVSTCTLLVNAGCSFRNSTYNEGFDFPTENVKQTVIGKTTGDELIQLFGGPFDKFEVSDHEERWEYYYSTGAESAEMSPLSNETQSNSQYKSLDILLKDGKVSTFSYTDSSQPAPVHHQGKVRMKYKRPNQNQKPTASNILSPGGKSQNQTSGTTVSAGGADADKQVSP